MNDTHVLVTGHFLLETLALARLADIGTGLGALVERRAEVEDLPVVEDGLGEGLAAGRRAQLAVEPEGLHDGQVRLHGEHGRADALLLREDLSTTLVQHGVDTADGVLRALDLDCTKGNQPRSGTPRGRCHAPR